MKMFSYLIVILFSMSCFAALTGAMRLAIVRPSAAGITVKFSAPHNAGFQGVFNGSTTRHAERFTTSSAYSVKAATIGIKNEALGSLAGTVHTEIWTNSGSLPGTTMGSSDTVTSTTYAAGADTLSFVFSTPIALSSSTTYWLVVTGDASYQAGTSHFTTQDSDTAQFSYFSTGSWDHFGQINTGLASTISGN